MTPERTVLAYEALLARALRFAAAVGERGPARADPAERWLARFYTRLRLHWVDDDLEDGIDVGTLLIPDEAFTLSDEGFSNWLIGLSGQHGASPDATSGPKLDPYDEILRRALKGRD